METINKDSGYQRLKKKFEIEKNAKNNAYAFIIESGLLCDYEKYSRAHRTENCHGRAIKAMVLHLPQNQN
jgi:hypothetical protein